eukprot:jgi/Tetstr1/444353/TSEL_032244.t1
MSRDCILSNHEVDALAEAIMEEVDSSLAPDPDTPAWSEERNRYQQINVVNGRPGTGKTTGCFRRHEGVDTRLPLRSSTLATPTNLLACDFGNKFKGAKTMNFLKAFRVPICGEKPKPEDVYKCNHDKKDAKNTPWSARTSAHDSIAYKQTIVIDEASQYTAKNIQHAIEVAKANHLQLFIVADYDKETGDIYHMGRVETFPDLSVTPLHRNIENVTDLALERINDTYRSNVRLFQPMQIDSRTALFAWFNRFLMEMGMNPRTHKKAHKGMTATVSKAEWRALFADDRFHSDRGDQNGEYPPTRRSALMYNDTNYSASKHSFANDKPSNNVNPMIACTAHNVQGREIGPEGVVYALIFGNNYNMGSCLDRRCCHEQRVRYMHPR